MKNLAISFVLSSFVLALAGQASAATVRYKSSGDWFDTTTNTGDVNGWQVAATGPGGLPGTADQARINWGNNTVTLAGDAGTIDRLYLGVDEPGNLVINPGGFLTAGRSGIGDGGANAGTFTINGGELLISTSRWDMGVSANAHTATVTINSGLMRVHAPYNQNKATTTTATTTLNGGVLRVNSLNLTTGVMDIAGGALRIVNVTEPTIDGWIADGLLRFYGKTGGVKDIDYSLTGITGAQLSFAAAYDVAAGDVIEIVIKNAATGDPIGDPISPINTASDTFSNWITLGPFDLSAADDTMIYLEFRYDGSNANYIGLYIDDVKVSQ